ncbi:CU044_5270 family protein [Nocardiopsis sp. EMB25]|uniref:CU044_5270 family protein n=1 Tax=Nocardiopsis sp. EMB25 TaxID=2835867 RepID=UPI00228398C1|nr:CU044_5270 family protein [Nocardiopsis sp. EMB25]MCY9785592.1 CU044_5270 family protein [Nocardiopsis sp. EMB25]
MDHLRRMRESVPEPTSDSLNARLAWRPGHPNAAATTVRRLGGRHVPGRVPPAVSGAAVLVAGAVFAFLVLGPPGFMRPDSVVLTPAAPSEGTGGEEPANDGSAAEAMAPAVEAARSRPADGAVWYAETVSARAWGVGPEGDRYGVYDIRETRHWTNVETDLHTFQHTSTDWALVTDRGREAWERDGAPTFWPAETTRLEIPNDMVLGEPYTPSEPGYFFGESPLGPRELQELPSDPERLREMLRPEGEEEQLDEGDTAEAGFHTVPKPSVATVRAVLDLPLPPEVRAGVYEVLAGLPDVRAAEGVTEDRSGRPAVGVAYDVEGLIDGRYEERLLFDPETGLPLASERVVVQAPEWAADWVEPGDVVEYTLHETFEWTDAWPDVEVPEFVVDE